MDLFIKYLERIVCFFLVILVVIMLAVGAMQVIWRYILQDSLSWSEEMMRYLYVWVTMIGVSIGIRRKGMAFISVIIDFVAKRTLIGKYFLAISGFLVQIILFAALTFYGSKFAAQTVGQISPGLRISMSYVYLSMPIGGVLSLIFTLDEIRGYFNSY